MNRRLLLTILALGLLVAGCGRLGLGLPSCDTPAANPDGAAVISLQAVPTADYAPCVRSLKLGWDEVEFDVESGRVALEIGREFEQFLTITLTESCDIGDAVEVPSGMDGISRYDDVTEVTDEVLVTIVPDGERARIHSNTLVRDLGSGIRIEDRTLKLDVDEDIDYSVRSRVNKALFEDDFVWIIGDIDIDEGTVEVRSTPDGEGARGLSINDALDRMEDMSQDVSYKGQWYFVFEGGCITYDFDAEGTVAGTIAGDVAESIGFYPNAELRQTARNAGYEITGP